MAGKTYETSGTERQRRDAEPIQSTNTAFRFRISDVLFWMICLGITLAALRHCGPPRAPWYFVDEYARYRAFLIGAPILALLYMGPVGSLVWTALFGWRSAAPFPRQPGHWLWMQVGLGMLERLAMAGRYPFDYGHAGLPLPWVWLPTIALAIVAGFKQADTNWRLFFAMLAGFRVMVVTLVTFGMPEPSFNSWDLLLHWLLLVVAAMLLIGAGISLANAVDADRRVPVQRDRLHTSGIAVLFLDLLAQLLLLSASPQTRE